MGYFLFLYTLLCASWTTCSFSESVKKKNYIITYYFYGRKIVLKIVIIIIILMKIMNIFVLCLIHAIIIIN